MAGMASVITAEVLQLIKKELAMYFFDQWNNLRTN